MLSDEHKVREYREAIGCLVVAAAMLRSIDFAELIGAIDKADALGPLLDPTLYREKAQAMHEDRALLVAARTLVEKMKWQPRAAVSGDADV